VNPFQRLFSRPAPVVVVSGLPRSGTSLMMQMLGAGGLPLLTDSHRPPDASNPRGYYEYAPVKRMHLGETAWLGMAHGRAVKIVTALLTMLPPDVPVRLIMMHRDLDEVVRSQRAMLTRLHKPTDHLDVGRLKAEYLAHLSAVQGWLERRAHLTWLDVHYAEVVCAPHLHVPPVASFLGGKLDVSAMVQAVEPVLYRERAL
jgi:hypothetical protein